ncbi:MAG: ABC transporter ATP-binding protein, partial [Myxococcales bacterium]|nr:ABC transporter ATP-binding protein [Myxococcales bacterium]
ELLVLDEPMSGLDPIGRKEIRDILLEQKKRGKTLLFTSHILSDVEMLCDRVGILRQGKMTHYGRLTELLRPETRRVEIVLADASDALEAELAALASATRREEGELVIEIEGTDGGQPVLQRALEAGARIVSVTPARETLEDLFVRDALAGAP